MTKLQMNDGGAGAERQTGNSVIQGNHEELHTEPVPLKNVTRT
jgi:hypothetical protein